jgi:(2R)-ethylmalonyl-CoA mutase
VPKDQLPLVAGRVSFFVNAGIRFIEECGKLRAFTSMWDQLLKQRYGVTDPALRRFRYGVQVNSLGLTEQQPENNVQRIVLQMLAAVLSKDARARAVQLPAWNEALGLPRPWDQQWSLRIQQVLALETDLLEYGDILSGSTVVNDLVEGLVAGAQSEMARIDEHGGIVAAVESGHIKRRLVESNAQRLRAIEGGEQVVVGVNRFQEGAESPLTSGNGDVAFRVDPATEDSLLESLARFKEQRDDSRVAETLRALAKAARTTENIMPASIECAMAGVTTGEWTDTLREIFGEYRPPSELNSVRTGIGDVARTDAVRERATETNRALGGRMRILVGKPGLDGHSNGAEQIALKARDVGFEVVYLGIRQTPRQLARTAVQEDVHLAGLSILSGSHLKLTREFLDELKAMGAAIPTVVGGIIPTSDYAKLRELGVAECFTPRDYDMNRTLAKVVDLIRQANRLEPYGELQ